MYIVYFLAFGYGVGDIFDKWACETTWQDGMHFVYPSECQMMIPGSYAQMIADYDN